MGAGARGYENNKNKQGFKLMVRSGDQGSQGSGLAGSYKSRLRV